MILLKARILEWVAISFSRGYSPPRVEPMPPVSPTLQTDSLPAVPSGKSLIKILDGFKKITITKYFIYSVYFLKAHTFY